MGLFDRFYYGKAGQRDYTEANMPKNRLSLFFLVLKDHLFDLVKVNLLQLIFWIPFRRVVTSPESLAFASIVSFA